MHKVLIVIGDASEMLDTMYPYYRVQEAGFQPVITAPEKRTYQMVLHEIKPGWTITKEWEGYTIEADVSFDEINPEDYVGIMFSGGRAPEYIRDHPDLIRITQWFFDHNKPIASLCHGVEELLLAADSRPSRKPLGPRADKRLIFAGTDPLPPRQKA